MGPKRPRLQDGAYCDLVDLDAGDDDDARSGLWTRGLLIRRTVADGDLAFAMTASIRHHANLQTPQKRKPGGPGCGFN